MPVPERELCLDELERLASSVDDVATVMLRRRQNLALQRARHIARVVDLHLPSPTRLVLGRLERSHECFCRDRRVVRLLSQIRALLPRWPAAPGESPRCQYLFDQLRLEFRTHVESTDYAQSLSASLSALDRHITRARSRNREIEGVYRHLRHLPEGSAVALTPSHWLSIRDRCSALGPRRQAAAGQVVLLQSSLPVLAETDLWGRLFLDLPIGTPTLDIEATPQAEPLLLTAPKG